MATDKFVPGDLVLVDFPGSGYWPCQVSRIMSKNWRKVEYFGGGEEIGKAHVQVIRDYDEATKDDLEEFIPKIKMDEDPILRQAVKQINQKFTGKKTKVRGVKKGTRNETKRMSDKIENGGKQNLQKTSDKKQMTAATNETRKTRGEKEFIGTNKEIKKNTGKGELEKKKIAKKAFIGARNKTKKITGITKILSTTKENDTKKENPRSLRARVSDMRGSDGLINADSPERDQSRPNNEVPLDNNTTGTSQNINSHLLLNGGVNSTNNNIETSPTGLGSSCGNNNVEAGAIDNSNSDICGASVTSPISEGTLVNNNHGVADDVDIIIKCEVDEDANYNWDTLGTENMSFPTTAEDAVVPGISASSENGGAFSTEDISAQEAPAAGCSASTENSCASSTEDISAQEAPAAGSSASTDKENSGVSSTEDITENNLGDPEHNTVDTVRLNISMQMSPNTFSQISPALFGEPPKTKKRARAFRKCSGRGGKLPREKIKSKPLRKTFNSQSKMASEALTLEDNDS